MGKDDYISDEEDLYRSIRSQLDNAEYYYNDNGQLIITSGAFRDRAMEPSVDRAKLKDFDPALSKLSASDGIVTLVSSNVRAIGDVTTRIDNKEYLEHSVDVIYDPIDGKFENIAHSQVTVRPTFFGSRGKQKNAFKLLRIALARLATQKGWALAP